MHCLLMVLALIPPPPWQPWCLRLEAHQQQLFLFKYFPKHPPRLESRKSAGSLTRMFISLYIINRYREWRRESGREGESHTCVNFFCGFKQLGVHVVEAISRQHTKWLTIFPLWLLLFLCIYHVYVRDLYPSVWLRLAFLSLCSLFSVRLYLPI